MSNPGYTALISSDPVTNNASVSVTLDGRTVSIPSDAANYEALVAALRARAPKEEVAKLLTPAEQFKTLAKDAGFEMRINTARDEIGVFLNGKVLTSKVCDMIIEHHRSGQDITALKNFLIKAMSNNNGVGEMDTLFDFITDGSLPLHPDGDFLAFKATKANGFDKHTGTVKYEVGEFLEVKNFDRDKFTQCGQGLHVGSRDYVQGYGSSADAYFIVKVNPADAIYYRDHSYGGKMRVCKLFVYAQVAYAGVKLTEFLPFMVASSPEGDILELAALDDDVKQVPSDIAEAAPEEQAPVVKLEGQNAKVAKKAAKGKTKTQKVKVAKAKKTQSFVSVGKGKMTFVTRDNRKFTADQVLKAVAEHGQRGWATLVGIPRTTIQEWLKVIAGATRTQ